MMKFSKFEGFCLKAVACLLIISLAYVLLSGFFNPDAINVRANRYSSCIERQSKTGQLTYEEMKEVCSEYLK